MLLMALGYPYGDHHNAIRSRMTTHMPPVCLSIGTSDSSGGAGVQSDLKTFLAYQCYGASVVVALSAQNLLAIRGLHPVPESFVRTQLEVVGEDLPISVVKVGFISSVGTMRVVARWLRERPQLPVVVDPVAADSRGIPLLQPEVVEALCDELMPRATISTPNRFEAALLSGMDECLSVEDMQEAAQTIFRRFGCPVVVTGGGLANKTLDVFAGLDGVSHFETPTCERPKVHGTGSCHSAAIAACLARGDSLREAIYNAKLYVSAAIAAAPSFGHGRSVLWHQIPVNELGVEVTPLGSPIMG
jgi:hydroxymethylpyrimidine/phosphomethylpyrimidine kinase